MASKLSVFLAELKRRKVGRVAVAYAVVGVGVMEAVDLFLTRLPVPVWIVDFLAILILLGFPTTVVLAWVIDITPQGFQRTPELPTDQLESHGPSQWSVGTWVFLAVGAAALSAVGYLGFVRGKGPVLENTRVAVMPFENLTGDPELDPVGRMIAGWISDGLTRTGLVDVVPTGVIVGALDAGAGTALDPLSSLAEGTGAGILVSGEVFLDQDSLQFHAQVTDASGLRILGSVQARGPKATPMDGVELLRQRVMGSVAPHVDPRIIGYAEVFHTPPTFEAYQEFIEGLAAFFRVDYYASIEHSRRAYQLDTTQVSALLHVSQAHRNLGQRAQWDSILDLVNQRKDRLPPPDRHLLEFNLAQREGDLETVYRHCRAWAESAPGYGQALYAHAWAAYRINRPREAIEVLEGADPRSWGLQDWQSYWLVLTTAYHLVGDHEGELRAAREGQEQYPNSVGRMQDELYALAALGRTNEAREVLSEIEAISRAGADYADRLQEAAGELRAHGHTDDAEALFGELFLWFEERPEDEKVTESFRSDLASALCAARRWEEALALYQELDAASPGRSLYLGHLGYLAARLGNRDEAKRIIHLLQELNPDSSTNTLWKARITAALGGLEEAVRLLEEDYQQGRAFTRSLHSDPHLEPLWGHPAFEDFMRPKG